MWRRWSAAVLKVICACFTPTGIHYLHSSSPKAPATAGGEDGKSTSQSASDTSISILHGSLTQEDVVSGLSSVPWKLHHHRHQQLWQWIRLVCLPFKSGVPQQWCLRGRLLGERGTLWNRTPYNKVNRKRPPCGGLLIPSVYLFYKTLQQLSKWH